MSERPAICLNMIVKDEAHIVRQVLDVCAPYISTWVIVDTGSTDGTQDTIRNHMAGLGIPGELHERPWRNFGHNQTEAMALAQGHGEYRLWMDADDVFIGAPDFTQLDADIYSLRVGSGFTYWRPQLIRSGLPVRCVGVIHAYLACDEPNVSWARLDGDYYVDSRRLGAQSKDPQRYVRDAQMLLAEVERNPQDSRSVFYLAQSYFDAGDYIHAYTWYQRRADMGGWEEEVYYSLNRVAQCMAHLGRPWPDIQDAYLRAWAFRPTRAEPLYHIAVHYRVERDYQLGYLFAERAAQIPLPEDDNLFVFADVYSWCAMDEQAVCASWIGKHAEAFALCRHLLTRRDIPEGRRQEIAGNRDFSVPALLDAASSYPAEVAGSLVTTSRESDVTVSLIAGPDLAVTERTLNSFLQCCTDVSRAGRFIVVDAGLSDTDRRLLEDRYGFLEFADCGGDGRASQMAQLRTRIHGRFWLHLGEGWQFFAPEDLITRLIGVLEAEPRVRQVGINYGDADKLTGVCASEQEARRTPDTTRYVLTDVDADGPAMVDTTRLDQADATATLDEVLCIRSVF
ncbi:glycosyltransferase [Mycobacterium sp. HM-7]